MKKLSFFLLCFLVLLATAQATITAVADNNFTFGGSTTSKAISVSVTPAANQVVYVAVQLGATPAPAIGITPSPGGDVWTQATCSNVGTRGQYLFYHVVVSGDTPALGTVAWSPASGGTIHVSLRSGVNTTTPVGICTTALASSSLQSPSLSVSTQYKNSLVEADFENATLGLCGTGAGTCNQSGWTESGYTNSAVFGEAQYDNTQGVQFPTAQINFTTTGTSTRILAWEDAPSGTLLRWCYGTLMMIGVGC